MKDLREFIEKIEDMGELKRIDGANWDLEIGAITEILSERQGPALLFDKISGYKQGYRVLSNAFNSYSRTALSVNLPNNLKPLEQLSAWRNRYKKFVPVKPRFVNEGSVLENVIQGDTINILKFPAPRWHNLDGGRYIGTGDAVITRDPENDVVNLGVYRVQIQDSKTLSLMIAPSKHGRNMIEKYHSKGKDAPVAITFGMDPVTWSCAAFPAPAGVSEYDLAGYVRGESVDVINGPLTGLPIPSTAEIAIEGFVPPISVESCSEGPFGEWTGYYAASFTKSVYKVKIGAIYHRHEPIILGLPPLKPPRPMHWVVPFEAAQIWDEIEGAGHSEVTGVWQPINLWGPLILIVAIKQRFVGQAKQIALAAAGSRKGSWGGRFIIIVDDDIDITNNEEVLWALATRTDANFIDVVRGVNTSILDPMTLDIASGSQRLSTGVSTAKVLIDACKPIAKGAEFPKENKFQENYLEEIRKKWNLKH